MASTADTVKRVFAALAAQDVEAMVACWEPGGVHRAVGSHEIAAPDGVRQYFNELFLAFPDLAFEIVEMTTARARSAVRWRAEGTFAGPGRFQGFAPNGARIKLEGCDVFTVHEGLVHHNDVYLDSGDIARQLGLLPAAGSPAEARLTRFTNARTRVASRIHGADPELIAEGVWIVRGGFPAKTMNVYLIQDDGGVTVFDAGIEAMGSAVAAAGARLGGIKRVVLGHADADHRGAAPALDAPVYCHENERAAAESDETFRDYWDFQKLAFHGRILLSRLLPSWDGGAVSIEDTVKEGDEVAGFRVVDLPGHAPGQIGLFRDSDRLALVSDCFYTLDPQTGIKGGARIPHPAFDADLEQTRQSIRKLADLEPAAAWAGHADPVTGDVSSALRQAASAHV
jgi:hydroxyacylglutathione hydrolase